MTNLSLAACLEEHRRVGGEVSLAVVASVDSSNRLARRVAAIYLGEERQVPRLAIVARGQTAGRGRRGRSWSSPAGKGIYTSLLLPLAGAAELAALPLRVPLELCRQLQTHGVSSAVKWPNDLVVDGRKLGGILIEALAGAKAVIVGYGINGNQDESELPAPEATSLRLESRREVDISAIAVDLAESLVRRLVVREATDRVISAYRRRSVHRTGDELTVLVGDERLRGRFAGFDDAGRLRLDTERGRRTLSSAEMLSERQGTDEAAIRP